MKQWMTIWPIAKKKNKPSAGKLLYYHNFQNRPHTAQIQYNTQICNHLQSAVSSQDRTETALGQHEVDFVLSKCGVRAVRKQHRTGSKSLYDSKLHHILCGVRSKSLLGTHQTIGRHQRNHVCGHKEDYLFTTVSLSLSDSLPVPVRQSALRRYKGVLKH